MTTPFHFKVELNYIDATDEYCAHLTDLDLNVRCKPIVSASLERIMQEVPEQIKQHIAIRPAVPRKPAKWVNVTDGKLPKRS